MKKTKWYEVSKVTTLSKGVALFLFISLPLVTFWIGYRNGFDTGSSEEAQNALVYSNACQFKTDQAYNAGAITDDDKAKICDFIRSDSSIKESLKKMQDGVKIAGKQGQYILINAKYSCLLQLGGATAHKIYCQAAGELPDCKKIDGLGVTSLVPQCNDLTLRKTK